MYSAYIVVEEASGEELCHTVNMYLKEGYQLQGGLCVFMACNEDNDEKLPFFPIYSQAMVK